MNWIETTVLIGFAVYVGFNIGILYAYYDYQKNREEFLKDDLLNTSRDSEEMIDGRERVNQEN